MRSPLIFAAALALGSALGIGVALAYRRNWTWTGFPEQHYPKKTNENLVAPKTLWDWMQLLFIPAVLAAGVFLLNRWQSTRDMAASQAQASQAQALALDDQREQALQRYLDAMTSLLLDRNLAKSSRKAEVRTVARTLTLTTLERLDGERRGAVVRFLYEARLIYRSGSPPINCPYPTARRCYGSPTIVDLSGANLADADLHDALLVGVNLPNVNLDGANLTSAILSEANLAGAHAHIATLTGAHFFGAHIDEAQFDSSDLTSTVFANAEGSCTAFRNSNLSDAEFGGVQLWFADFSKSNLTHVDFSDARLPDVNFASSTFETEPIFRRAKWNPRIFPAPPSAGERWDEKNYCSP